MAIKLIPVTLSIRPWFHDHSFNGMTVLPAVEAMSFLALRAGEFAAGIDPKVMSNGSFARFLEIMPGTGEMEVLVGLENLADGGVRAGLFSRKRFSSMTRTVCHCELTLRLSPSIEALPGVRFSPSAATAAVEIPAAVIYRELVPFGPAYRTLQGKLQLIGEYAEGMVEAPEIKDISIDRSPLGNPFPLDGAMHAACVHGQRMVDFVPFPVGFAKRVIHRPTMSGERYCVQVYLKLQDCDELVYDIEIFDHHRRMRETVIDLRMRDVSGGRIRPPDWLRAL